MVEGAKRNEKSQAPERWTRINHSRGSTWRARLGLVVWFVVSLLFTHHHLGGRRGIPRRPCSLLRRRRGLPRRRWSRRLQPLPRYQASVCFGSTMVPSITFDLDLDLSTTCRPIASAALLVFGLVAPSPLPSPSLGDRLSPSRTGRFLPPSFCCRGLPRQLGFLVLWLRCIVLSVS